MVPSMNADPSVRIQARPCVSAPTGDSNRRSSSSAVLAPPQMQPGEAQAIRCGGEQAERRRRRSARIVERFAEQDERTSFERSGIARRCIGKRQTFELRRVRSKRRVVHSERFEQSLG